MDQNKLINEILEATRSGSVTGWSNRLGVLAEYGCVKTELINWYQSPKAIATEIVQYAQNNNGIEYLVSGLSQYQYELQC